jgi:hypothetical protein
VRRVIGIAAVALCLAAAGQAAAQVPPPPKSCGAGVTGFVDGDLRIFGIHYRTAFERGFEEYACLGRRRPLLVGGVGSDNGVGSAETSVYAHAGRYLAAYSQSDGEGGPDADVTVVDLVRRRTVGFLPLACCEWRPSIRLATDGTIAVLSPGEGVIVKRRGERARTLAGEGSGAHDLAMFGGNVYWTAGGQAQTAGVPGVSGTEVVALEPVRLRRHGGACMRAKGHTIAASGSVRVYETPDARYACRIGRPGRILLAGSSPPRIVADRWLLVYGEASARVIDTRSGRTVAHERSVAQATLLADGTLAWLDLRGGGLFARSPGADAVVLSEGAPGLMAAARRAVYWTENGIPQVYRPPSAARSASKPG